MNSQKKILLIGINARYSHPAMALYYLKEYVRDLRMDVIIREFTIRDPVEDIVKYIKEEDPCCAAFSVYIWNTSLVREILRKLECMRDRPVIVLGGPDAGYNPDTWLSQYSSIDYIISGHGEEAFRSLLVQDFRCKERIIKIKNPAFSCIPFPYTDEELRGFIHRMIYYESGRGCAFRCAYCLSSRADQRLEFKDISLVKNELELIMKHKPGIIKFVDRTFNINKPRARAAWEHIINSYADSGTRFHFEIHPALLNEDDFRLLSRSPPGLFQFEIGIQSTCEETLRAVKRKGDWTKIKPAIKRLIDMGTIHIHIDLIAGLPFEDYNGLAFSFNEAYSLGADHFQLGYLKLLPGTELSERKAELGLNSATDPPYEVTGTKWLSSDQMKSIKKISRLVDVFYNPHRFKRTMENLLPLYRSPFHFFEKLACGIPNEKGAQGMTWECAAKVIMDSTSSLKEYTFILDCLRWDWCSSSKTNRCPRLLKNDALRKKRKELLTRLQRRARLPGAALLNEAIVKRSNFFMAETPEFRERYLDGKSCALFPPEKHERIFLE